MNTIKIDEFKITELAARKGSAFTKSFNVDLNGRPFATIRKFDAVNGGNWYVGFAFIQHVGGRFNTYNEAERFVRAQA